MLDNTWEWNKYNEIRWRKSIDLCLSPGTSNNNQPLTKCIRRENDGHFINSPADTTGVANNDVDDGTDDEVGGGHGVRRRYRQFCRRKTM